MIKRLEFSIDIKADKTTIWKALWDENSYRDWAAVFFEGSYYIADSLKQGSRIMFLAPDLSGIYSTIEIHIPNEIIQFTHIGTVVKGKEQAIDDETKKWSGTTESYTLSEGSDAIILTVEIDVLDEHLEFMSTKLPEALERIKKNCV